jgi:hypothetical protein
MFGVSWLQGDYAPTFNGIPIAQYLDVIFMIYMSYLAIRLPRSV